MLHLEAYSAFKKSGANIATIAGIELHLDTLFDDWYFTLPNIPGEFEITAIANLNLLEELNVANENKLKEFFMIGMLWNTKNTGYFLCLKISGDGHGKVYVLPVNDTSNEHDLIFVCDSFKIFIEKVL